MTFSIKKTIIALSLGAMTLTGLASAPAFAQQRGDSRDGRYDNRGTQRDDRRVDRDRQGNRGDNRYRVDQRHRDERRPIVRNDRRPVQNYGRQDYRRPGKVVYSYDWNRPDRRYGNRYRPERYYRAGYAPMPVNRQTRIYRGYDDRYYCRRSDGTTGLIIGAALGGLLGGQIDQGYSNTAGILIGGGAGALLGREIDRGGLSCR